MYEGFGGISVLDRSIRKVSGGERPMGDIPSMTGDSCVTREDLPSCCAACSYGANGELVKQGDLVACGHPDMIKHTNGIRPSYPSYMATMRRAPNCPLTINAFRA